MTESQLESEVVVAASAGDSAILERPGVQRVREALRAAGITGEMQVMPETASSAAAAAEQIGCPVGAIANSLIFEADGAPLLVLTSGAHRVDTAALAARIGVAKIRRASADFVREATGQTIGGIAPLGHPAPVRTLVDETLAGYEVIWAAGGHHQAVFPTDFAGLVAATAGEVVAVD